MQDEAQVIYTVAYPQKFSFRNYRNKIAKALRNSMSRGLQLLQYIGLHLEKLGSVNNAWGYDTYGMRLATVCSLSTAGTEM